MNIKGCKTEGTLKSDRQEDECSDVLICCLKFCSELQWKPCIFNILTTLQKRVNNNDSDR